MESFQQKKGHLIKFDEFCDQILDQDILDYIDKKVRIEDDMKHKCEMNYDVEQYLQWVEVIPTLKFNQQICRTKKINLHLLNNYQQSISNSLQFCLDLKIHYVILNRLFFFILLENDFKGISFQATNLIQEIQNTICLSQLINVLISLLQNISQQIINLSLFTSSWMRFNPDTGYGEQNQNCIQSRLLILIKFLIDLIIKQQYIKIMKNICPIIQRLSWNIRMDIMIQILTQQYQPHEDIVQQYYPDYYS